MKVGIVGYGILGHALERVLARGKFDIVIYDRFKEPFNSKRTIDAINRCSLVFLAVPTNQISNTGECDLSQVEECVSWIQPPICIKSTIVPGTVERLRQAYGKRIGFSPEYLGEQPEHPWTEIDSAGFVIVGGSSEIQDLVISTLQGCLGPQVQFHRTDATTAELCKYMENCFLATKVAFANQFYDIARVLGVDFAVLRRLWLLDPRVGQSHSEVLPQRGFGGRCLPKDLRAIIAAMRDKGGAPILQAVSNYNDSLKCVSLPDRQVPVGLAAAGTTP